MDGGVTAGEGYVANVDPNQCGGERRQGLPVLDVFGWVVIDYGRW